jgi:hypothetical protein
MFSKNLSTKYSKDSIRYPVFIFLMGVGCLQMVGDVFKIKSLKAFGLALQASPAPKVFTAHEGFETYSSEFFLDWKDTDKQNHSLKITPKEYYHGILGPYNRRNAYGAALSYGPILSANEATRPMFESIAKYALCNDAPILTELGIDRKNITGPVTIRLQPRQKISQDKEWKLSYEISCF